MTKPFAIGIVLVAVAGYFAFVSYATPQTTVKPYRVVAPRVDIYVPKSCEGEMQKMFPTVRTDVTVPVDVYLRLKQKVADCGGRMVEEKAE